MKHNYPPPIDSGRHPGYNAKESPEWNVMQGRKKGYSYLRIGKELEDISIKLRKKNPEASRTFDEASHLAYEKHDEYGN
jgi:hypothetical protein